MKINKGVIFLFTAFAIVGCKKEPSYFLVKSEETDRSRTYVNPMVPEELKEKMLHREGAHGTAAPDSHGSAPKVGIPPDGYTKMAATVYLVEKTPGILGYKNRKITFGPGGGSLDLAEFVDTKKRGTFYFAIVPEESIEGEVSVFWVSDSPLRKVDGDLLGSGCSKYFDITSVYKKEMAADGFTVNTSEMRYISALGGEFYLKKQKETSIYLSTIRVLDSRYPEYSCKK